MTASLVSSLLLCFSFFSCFQKPIFAEKKSYIVYLGTHPRRLNASAIDYDHAVNYHYEVLGSCLGSIEKAKASIFYSYNIFINGFAAVLDDDEIEKVAKHPKVLSVFLNQARKIHTTQSWDYLGLEKNYDTPLNSAWKKARFGEDTIIGNLDSGVWPESKSFSDDGMGPVPSRWRGICQTNKKDGVKCNRKLIGVRFFNRGYLLQARTDARNMNTTFNVDSKIMSARDYSGHGTHTLSTAGGNFVDSVNLFGIANGTAKGRSPRARVATYKVCWAPIEHPFCLDADVLAGFEAAIYDGVDVISMSIGGKPVEFFKSGIAIGAFHAIMNNIIAVASAGNEGPALGSVDNVAPWIFTVAASRINREFINYVTLGNKKVIKGSSLSVRGLSSKSYPLIRAVDARADNATPIDANLCKPGTLDMKKVNGTILVCLRGITTKGVKIEEANRAGAVGMIVVNNNTETEDIDGKFYPLPHSYISFTDGQSLLAYIKSTQTPMASISDVQTEFNTTSPTIMATFSSIGPSQLDPVFLKPDVTAPGVNILAANTEGTPFTMPAGDKQYIPYITMSGTSMSCPHVAGIAGLLKTVHPDWSPSTVRSAIMTTARTKGGSSKRILNSTRLQATPFAYGAGHVRPNSAMDPGLVYDLTVQDYINYLCYRGYNQSTISFMRQVNEPYTCPKHFKILNFNYPSITVPNFNGKVTIARKLKNVGSSSTYNVRIKRPLGVSVFVEPSSLKFTRLGEEKTFKITFIRKGKVKTNNYAFGQLIWADGYHYVRTPITVMS